MLPLPFGAIGAAGQTPGILGSEIRLQCNHSVIRLGRQERKFLSLHFAVAYLERIAYTQRNTTPQWSSRPDVLNDGGCLFLHSALNYSLSENERGFSDEACSDHAGFIGIILPNNLSFLPFFPSIVEMLVLTTVPIMPIFRNFRKNRKKRGRHSPSVPM